MNMPSGTRRIVRRVSSLAVASVLAGTVLPVAAATGQPLVPMAVYGTVTVSGAAAPGHGSVQAWLSGTPAGEPLALSAGGNFGSLGGDLLVIPGTGADQGQPLSFTVNGVLATAKLGACGPGSDQGTGVAWEPALVCSVTLTVGASVASAGLQVATDVPPAQVGGAYADQFSVSGGTAPYTWSLGSGSALPAGLSLSPSGLLSGTPTAAGPVMFTVDVTDSSSPVLTAAQPLGLLVAPAGVVLGAESSGSTTADGSSAKAGGSGTGTRHTTVQGNGGTGTVLVGDYRADPESSAPSAQGGLSYFDVSVGPGSSFSSVTVERCNVGSASKLYWWNGAANTWDQVSPAVYAGGCLTADLNDTSSSPLVSQLGGTPFAVSGIVVVAPSGGGTGLTGGGGTFVSGGTPSVTAAPAVTGLNPATGAAGATVTVTGTGFSSVTGVYFGTVSAPFTVQSGAQLVTTVPAGSGTVDVTVVTAAGRSATGTPDRFAYTLPPPQQPVFSDVPADFWAAQAIDTLVTKGIVDGFPNGTFEPNAPVTRAEFVKMLLLTVGGKPGTGVTSFTDVPVSAWYASYVSAAVHSGIVDGTSATTFSPNATLTREQMAVMLARALNLSRTVPLQFNDDSQIAPWALQGVEESVAAGYIGGFPNGSLQPLGPATRAQAAKVLARVLQGGASAAG